MTENVRWDSPFADVHPVVAATASEATSTLAQLLADSPRADQPIDWEAAERALGTSLPSDYRTLSEMFGPGVYAGEVVVAAPGSPFDLIASAREHAEMQRAQHEDAPYRYPIFPEAEGALTWGRTPSAVDLAWMTRGEPDDWPVAVIDAKAGPEPTLWIYRGSMSQLVLDVVTAKLTEVPLLVDEEDPARLTFDPY